MRLPLTLVAVLLAPVFAQAQAVDIRSITPVVDLSVPASAYNLSTGEASVTAISAIETRLRSNVNWTFTVRSSSSLFSHTPASGVPVTSKPVSHLLIRENGTPSFVPLSTSNVVISSGASGSNIRKEFDLRFDTTLNDTPGRYSVTLIFTLVTL